MARASKSRKGAKKPSNKVARKPAHKATKYVEPKKASKQRKYKKYSSSSSGGGISQDAMVLMALTQQQSKGQPLEAIIPYLLLTSDNSLKTNLIPLIIYHLQANGGQANGNCYAYLLAFQNGTLGKNELALYMTQLKDQFGQPLLGNGMGGNQNLALAMMATQGGRGGLGLDARTMLLLPFLQGQYGFTNEQAMQKLKGLDAATLAALWKQFMPNGPGGGPTGGPPAPPEGWPAFFRRMAGL